MFWPVLCQDWLWIRGTSRWKCGSGHAISQASNSLLCRCGFREKVCVVLKVKKNVNLLEGLLQIVAGSCCCWTDTHWYYFFFPMSSLFNVLNEKACIRILCFHTYGSLILMWRFKSSLYVLVINSTDQKINMHVYSFLLYSGGFLVCNMLLQFNCIFEITVKILSPALLVVPVIDYLRK